MDAVWRRWSRFEINKKIWRNCISTWQENRICPHLWTKRVGGNDFFMLFIVYAFNYIFRDIFNWWLRSYVSSWFSSWMVDLDISSCLEQSHCIRLVGRFHWPSIFRTLDRTPLNERSGCGLLPGACWGTGRSPTAGRPRPTPHPPGDPCSLTCTWSEDFGDF